MRVASRPRPTRWTEECTAILLSLSAGGYTDQRIADQIEERTGLRFHRNKVLLERRDRLIGARWHGASFAKNLPDPCKCG
jgi:hypothetical protein